MRGGFIRKEPLNSTKLHEHPEVVALFTRANWMSFFEKFHGYDEEVTEEFLLKTENAISNLLIIHKEKKLDMTELREVPLMKTFFIMRNLFLSGVFIFFFRFFARTLKTNLLSLNPSLFLFDIYKLGLLAQKTREL